MVRGKKGWFSFGTLVSFTNQTDHHDITEKLVKVALNTIKQTNKQTNLTKIYIKLDIIGADCIGS
jgi:hypothetical protein